MNLIEFLLNENGIKFLMNQNELMDYFIWSMSNLSKLFCLGHYNLKLQFKTKNYFLYHKRTHYFNYKKFYLFINYIPLTFILFNKILYTNKILIYFNVK